MEEATLTVPRLKLLGAVLVVCLLAQWNTWKQDLENITTISLNRWFCFHKENDNDVELHVFCDAATITIGAVQYLRCIILR